MEQLLSHDVSEWTSCPMMTKILNNQMQWPFHETAYNSQDLYLRYFRNAENSNWPKSKFRKCPKLFSFQSMYS